MKAVVYTSCTGHTKRYAEILAEKLKLDVYTSDKVKNHLKSTDEVIYLGWICAGSIKGFEKVKKNYTVLAVCAIGMPRNDEAQNQGLIKRHDLKEIPFFYLQGGYEGNKLKGINKFMMKMMSKVIIGGINKKENKTEEDIETLAMLGKGISYVKEENLNKVIEWYNK